MYVLCTFCFNQKYLPDRVSYVYFRVFFSNTEWRTNIDDSEYLGQCWRKHNADIKLSDWLKISKTFVFSFKLSPKCTSNRYVYTYTFLFVSGNEITKSICTHSFLSITRAIRVCVVILRKEKSTECYRKRVSGARLLWADAFLRIYEHSFTYR